MIRVSCCFILLVFSVILRCGTTTDSEKGIQQKERQPLPVAKKSSPFIPTLPIWSTSVSSLDSLPRLDNGKYEWTAIKDTELAFTVEKQSVVVIKYSAGIHVGNRYAPRNSLFDKHTDRDFLAMRLVVNGIPFRETGSHMSASRTLRGIVYKLQGSFIRNFKRGKQEVFLEWKRWGDAVDTYWTGGQHSCRYIVAEGIYNQVAFAQSLKPSLLFPHMQSSWKKVEGLACTVDLQHHSEAIVSYHLTVGFRKEIFKTSKVMFSLVHSFINVHVIGARS